MGDALQEREDKVFTNANVIASTLKVDGDTNNRFQQRPSGKLEWGSGSATPDVVLERTAAGALAPTTGSIVSGGAIAANGDTLTVTQALHANKVVQIGKTTGTTVTLPAATGTGDRYTFVIGVTATSNGNVIKVANATDVMDGSLNIQQDTDSDGSVKVWRADVADDTMTFAGAATTGGIVGGRIECIDYKAGFWSCTAWTQSGGGSEATPFSATVS